MRSPTPAEDEAFDIALATVLRIGVLASALVVSLGGIVFLVRHGFERPVYQVFHGEPGDLRAARSIVRDALAMSGRAMVQCGLLLLIATPVARVVLSVAGFARERDWLYVGVTLVVLALLIYSLNL